MFPSSILRNVAHALRVKGLSLTVVDQAIFSIGNFTLSIIIGRFFGLEALGEYTIAIALCFLLLSFAVGLVSHPTATIAGAEQKPIDLNLIFAGYAIFGILSALFAMLWAVITLFFNFSEYLGLSNAFGLSLILFAPLFVLHNHHRKILIASQKFGPP